MLQFQCHALILSAQNFFEKDKRLDVFTEEMGKITVLAKGANSPKFKFGGRIEPLNYVSMALFKGRQFFYCQECAIVETYPHIRESYESLMGALYLADLVKKATVFEQPNPELFTLLRYSWQAIQAGDAVVQVKEAFQKSFLQLEGIDSDEADFKLRFESYAERRVTAI